MQRKKVAYADHAWLRMDDPNNLMVITGLMTFDSPLDYGRLLSLIENSLLPFRRFRQRLVQPILPFMRPSWEDDPNFDLESHVVRVKLQPPADKKALQDLISLLMSTGLDFSRPLWQFYLVENYQSGSAFIARLHHGLADGIALTQVLLSLTETSPDSTKLDQPVNNTQAGETPSDQPVKTLKSTALSRNSLGIKDIWGEGKKVLTNPSHAWDITRQGIDMAAAVGKLALRWPDPRTVFKGPLGVEKCAAWCEPLELSEVKFIGKAFNCTVNDVLITAVAGAFGRYVDFRGADGENVNIRGFIPVNLRPIELDEELGNKFGLVFLSLPLGIPDPIDRLHKVKQNMDRLKSSVEPLAVFGILNLMGAIPSRLEEIAVDFFDTKGTTVMTNVPGPQKQLYLAGVPINTLMAWVPQSGRIGVGVSIISYRGKVWLGIATDKGLVPDPESILTFFNVEFDALRSRAQAYRMDRRKTLQPMLSMLDEAMQTLDELIDQAATDSPAEPPAELSPPSQEESPTDSVI
jgi:diacylglycerol O-acyltransferase / wax synthase